MAALAVAAWAGLWSLLAVSNPELPRVSERVLQPTSGTAPAAPMRLAGDDAAMREQLARQVQKALGGRLLDGQRFSTVRVESVRLAAGHADIRLWGLLLSDRAEPAMLEVDLRLDRELLNVQRLSARAYSPHGPDPVLTAWFAGSDAVSQASP